MKSRFISIGFLCLFSCSGQAQAFLDFGIALPSWRNKIMFSDNSAFSDITLKRNKMFDYHLGFQLNGNNKLKHIKLLAAFSKNSLSLQCNDFYGDGQLVRTFNLYNLFLQLDRSFDVKIFGRKLNLDAGINFNKSLLNDNSSQSQYYKPGSIYDASYARFEKVIIKVPDYSVGCNARISCNALINAEYRMKLYIQFAYTVASQLKYDWIFMAKPFVNGSANRFTPTFGVQFPLKRITAIK